MLSLRSPLLLTNASSVLAMSTVNRMMRAHDRMHSFFAKSEVGELSDFFTAQVDRVEIRRRATCHCLASTSACCCQQSRLEAEGDGASSETFLPAGGHVCTQYCD